jgi:copper transport protein
MQRLLPLACVLFLLLAVAGPVLAHAELVRATPEANAALDEAPPQVELNFSEALEPSFSSITVLDATGATVDNGDSRVDPLDGTRLTISLRSLPAGVYTVAWKALSAVDGHVTTGAYPFAVGDVDAAALAAADQASRQVRLSVGEIIARWLTYLSAGMLVGGTLFVLAVWRPALRRASSQAPPEAETWLPARRLAVVALVALALGAALTLLVHAGQATGAEVAAPWSQAVGNVLFHTRWGALWLARLALLLALAGLLLGSRLVRDLWLALGAGLLLLLTISLGSHAAAEPRPVLPVLADWVHLMTASTWVGGLTHFAAALWALRRARRAGNAPASAPLVAVLLPRFSALALVSVAVLSVTGIYLAVLRLGAWEALTGTLYGRTLTIKLALAALMLLLGAFNLLLVTPRVRPAGHTAANPSGLAWLRRSVTSEVTLGAAVMLTVGLFTALPPARVASSAPEVRRTATADDVNLTLSVSPGRVGLNTFTLRATSGGQPVTGANEVVLRFTPATASLAPSEAVLAEQGSGVYSARGAYLSLPDTWQVQAVVRRPDRFDAFANFDLSVSSAGAAGGTAFPWHRVTGSLLLAAAVLFAFAANQLAGAPAPRSLVPAVALFAAGVFVFYQAPPGRPGANVINPIPPNAASVAEGQALYATNCLPCHGPTGKGDGPVGLTLNPRPADLSLHAVPGVHTDGQLYLWITNGFEGSVMPAFKDVLTDDQRWHLVNYVRTLTPQ